MKKEDSEVDGSRINKTRQVVSLGWSPVVVFYITSDASCFLCASVFMVCLNEGPFHYDLLWTQEDGNPCVMRRQDGCMAYADVC